MKESFYIQLKTINESAKANISTAKANAITAKLVDALSMSGSIISEEKAFKKTVEAIRLGANINHSNGWHKSLIEQAIINDFSALAELLVGIGCNVTSFPVITTIGSSCMPYQTDKDIIKKLDYYLSLGANINMVDSNSVSQPTAVHYFAKKGREEVLKYLIEQGANVNIKNALGNTALEDAIMNNQLYCARVLHRAGARFDNLSKQALVEAEKLGLIRNKSLPSFKNDREM